MKNEMHTIIFQYVLVVRVGFWEMKFSVTTMHRNKNKSKKSV